MKIVQQTIASLGSPRWIELLEQHYGSAAVIARWRHLNGLLRISTADAIRVCLSLCPTQHSYRPRSQRALRPGAVLSRDVSLRKRARSRRRRLCGSIRTLLGPRSTAPDDRREHSPDRRRAVG